MNSAAATSALDSPRAHLDQHLQLPLGQSFQLGGRDRLGRVLRPELLDDPSGHGRVEHRVTVGDEPDRTDQPLCRGALEQEPAGADPQRREHVLVDIEGGQHDHLRAGGVVQDCWVAANPSSGPLVASVADLVLQLGLVVTMVLLAREVVAASSGTTGA